MSPNEVVVLSMNQLKVRGEHEGSAVFFERSIVAFLYL